MGLPDFPKNICLAPNPDEVRKTPSAFCKLSSCASTSKTLCFSKISSRVVPAKHPVSKLGVKNIVTFYPKNIRHNTPKRFLLFH